MGLPAVTRVVQWGDSDVYKVGGKVFAIVGDEGMSFKVSEIGFMVLTEGGPARQAEASGDRSEPLPSGWAPRRAVGTSSDRRLSVIDV